MARPKGIKKRRRLFKKTKKQKKKLSVKNGETLLPANENATSRESRFKRTYSLFSNEKNSFKVHGCTPV